MPLTVNPEQTSEVSTRGSIRGFDPRLGVFFFKPLAADTEGALPDPGIRASDPRRQAFLAKGYAVPETRAGPECHEITQSALRFLGSQMAIIGSQPRAVALI